jgi:transposase-like protein
VEKTTATCPDAVEAFLSSVMNADSPPQAEDSSKKARKASGNFRVVEVKRTSELRVYCLDCDPYSEISLHLCLPCDGYVCNSCGETYTRAQVEEAPKDAL